MLLFAFAHLALPSQLLLLPAAAVTVVATTIITTNPSLLQFLGIRTVAFVRYVWFVLYSQRLLWRNKCMAYVLFCLSLRCSHESFFLSPFDRTMSRRTTSKTQNHILPRKSQTQDAFVFMSLELGLRVLSAISMSVCVCVFVNICGVNTCLIGVAWILLTTEYTF